MYSEKENGYFTGGNWLKCRFNMYSIHILADREETPKRARAVLEGRSPARLCLHFAPTEAKVGIPLTFVRNVDRTKNAAIGIRAVRRRQNG
jgi:hypothetical protein